MVTDSLVFLRRRARSTFTEAGIYVIIGVPPNAAKYQYNTLVYYAIKGA